MPEPITLRPARPEDLPALEEVYTASRRLAFWWEPPALFQPGDFAPDTKGEWVAVALLGGAVSGFLSLWVPERFVHHLYVAPEAQGHGLGRALLDYTCTIHGPGVLRLKCLVQNLPALAFYARLGFVEDGTRGTSERGPWVGLARHP